MIDLSQHIVAAIRTSENRRLLQSQPAFRTPDNDDRFTALLSKLDTIEPVAA